VNAHYLPVAAWHLIKRTAIKHPPKIVSAAAGFFIFQMVIGRLRSGSWIDSILLALITTALLIFVVAALYILFTQPGYRLFNF